MNQLLALLGAADAVCDILALCDEAAPGTVTEAMVERLARVMSAGSRPRPSAGDGDGGQSGGAAVTLTPGPPRVTVNQAISVLGRWVGRLRSAGGTGGDGDDGESDTSSDWDETDSLQSGLDEDDGQANLEALADEVGALSVRPETHVDATDDDLMFFVGHCGLSLGRLRCTCDHHYAVARRQAVVGSDLDLATTHACTPSSPVSVREIEAGAGFVGTCEDCGVHDATLRPGMECLSCDLVHFDFDVVFELGTVRLGSDGRADLTSIRASTLAANPRQALNPRTGDPEATATPATLAASARAPVTTRISRVPFASRQLGTVLGGLDRLGDACYGCGRTRSMLGALHGGLLEFGCGVKLCVHARTLKEATIDGCLARHLDDLVTTWVPSTPLGTSEGIVMASSGRMDVSDVSMMSTGGVSAMSVSGSRPGSDSTIRLALTCPLTDADEQSDTYHVGCHPLGAGSADQVEDAGMRDRGLISNGLAALFTRVRARAVAVRHVHRPQVGVETWEAIRRYERSTEPSVQRRGRFGRPHRISTSAVVMEVNADALAESQVVRKSAGRGGKGQYDADGVWWPADGGNDEAGKGDGQFDADGVWWPADGSNEAGKGDGKFDADGVWWPAQSGGGNDEAGKGDGQFDADGVWWPAQSGGSDDDDIVRVADGRSKARLWLPVAGVEGHIAEGSEESH